MKQAKYKQRAQQMLNYLKMSIWVKKDIGSICICTFKLDKDGNKTPINTKYSFDNRNNFVNGQFS